MGRSNDKPFIAQEEWSKSHGLGSQEKKDAVDGHPFDCCALSLKPFANPVCTPDGYVFDRDNITKFVNENHKHPFTGEPLSIEDLTALHYHKNTNGDYIDPISFRQFSKFTKIVANKRSGYVYSWASIDEFNIRPKAWADLVTGEPFGAEDIIVLQDPDARKKSTKTVIDKAATKDITKAVTNVQKPVSTAPNYPTAAKSAEKTKQPYNAASYSKGLAAASFTSTAMAPVTKNELELVPEQEYMFGRIKEKAYARIVTNLGDINLELHCDKAPRTCYNFIKLAGSGYYKGVKFHRSVKNFMIQGGDPTGTGKGGESCWGKNFADEVSKKLKHSARGVLSMANRGPGTNGSQFFILYRAAGHLDGKHTVFGRVVGGLPVLDKMEAVPTDDSDRPTSDIVINDVLVFVDPYAEFSSRVKRKLEHEQSERDLAAGKRQLTAAEEEREERETTTWLGTKVITKTGKRSSTDSEASQQKTGAVGRYMKRARIKAGGQKSGSKKTQAEIEALPSSTKAAKDYKFGDFSGW
ncbi:cyclophilin peptidyl-prolyl cis-trans isomerase Cyp8 [Coemansia sp. RSA 1722]|nr:cyclophilin peptidyl-prolyl cis-trans isomerase Cyp8 [Coemansia sp. RSA 486]KAJ2235282.1 cyclophilin peptidyl-prolyl cis-trans isomerase Cyp8 [Coemansia sp. RSA 485]KAJ2596719.1 cyclophilin peptidyl-prolyl cis-trans isomerase Cyp8 [Coemansia sp. RSA 1722]KAJ2600681.1 cyclophilin peptidyl-prolyl cis-trans isomerase Cyp8 [Coemansia sp. RSA 1721]KAJ2637487.1 cyclophilin peptidyl-prolyl cis-trans isomerase Cyp8 [Coemansia sp. RSA 1286]